MRKLPTTRLFLRQPTHLRHAKLHSNHAFMEPSVQVRELKPDRVNFVLENVDLSYASISITHDYRSVPRDTPPGSQTHCDAL